MLDLIVCELKQKWKIDRQNNYPTMKSKNSASGKKIIKSMNKYETYVMRTMWARWMVFSKKLDRIKNDTELQRILKSTFEFIVRINETLVRQSSTSEMNCEKKVQHLDLNKELKEKDIKNQENKDGLPEKIGAESDWFLSESNPFQLQPDKVHFTMPIYESPNPSSSTATAQVLSKNFTDLNMVSLQELSDTIDSQDDQQFRINHEKPSEKCLDLEKIWKGNPRWMQIKHNLIQKGVLLMKGLHISLPVHRREFLIGKGNFGNLEFAFSHKFYGIALKRLTEYGQVSPSRCDGIRRVLDEMDQHSMVTLCSNLLRSTAFQDMCGYTFMYTMICDYNLTEYLIQLTGENLDDAILEDKKHDMIKQMVNGLGALHLNNKPIVHGNLKPSNVLVTVGGVVKLSEFGIYQV